MTTLDTPITGQDLPWHLRENRAPVNDEVTLTELEVRGSIPADLKGRYLRNGANPQTGQSEHWFLGDGMIHGIELADGKANWYRNRYVRTPMFANPGVERMDLYLNPETIQFNFEVGVANTHVIGHAGRIFALEEGSFPYELNCNLDTVGVHTFDGKLTTAMTAHPKICPETGELLFFGYSSLPPYLTYHRVSAAGELLQSTEITVGGPTMMHDFTVSRDHSVFFDLPAIFDMELAMSGGMPIRWSDEYPARMGVMPREGSDADVQWFDVDPCYMFHSLNAHDEGDEVRAHHHRVGEADHRSSIDVGAGDLTAVRHRGESVGDVERDTEHGLEVGFVPARECSAAVGGLHLRRCDDLLIAVGIVVCAAVEPAQLVVQGSAKAHEQGGRFGDRFVKFDSHSFRRFIEAPRGIDSFNANFVDPEFDCIEDN